MKGNHAYEKLESNAQEHSEIKDLEFHSRSKIIVFALMFPLFFADHTKYIYQIRGRTCLEAVSFRGRFVFVY